MPYFVSSVKNLLLFSLCVALSTCAGGKKNPSSAVENRKNILLETPEPISEKSRSSADALRETNDNNGKPNKNSYRGTTTNSSPKPIPQNGLKNAGAPTPLATDASLGKVGLKILFIDVGQADAILLIGPKASLLVDAGEVTQKQKKSQNYKKIARKIYELTGQNHIDYFVPSHYHVDHMGSYRWENGLFGLIPYSGISVGTIVDRGDLFYGAARPGGWKGYPEAVSDWLDAKMVGARITARLGSDQIDLGEGVIVEVVAVNGEGVLAKIEDQDPSYFETCPPSENDYSVALKISLGDFEFFTGGDLSGENIERKFGKKCQCYNDIETPIANRVGDVELFKATHHGSEHSNNEFFVKTLDPEFSVIPSGGGYSHPAKRVAETLMATSMVVDTGGFSPKEWPNGGPANIPVVGDVLVEVAASGKFYRVKHSLDEKFFRTYTDAEEQKDLDQNNQPLSQITP